MSKPTVQSYAAEARSPRLNHSRAAVNTGKWRVGDSPSTVCPSSRSAWASTEMPTYVPLPRAMSCGVEVRKRNLKVSGLPAYPSAAEVHNAGRRRCRGIAEAAAGVPPRTYPTLPHGRGSEALLEPRPLGSGCQQLNWLFTDRSLPNAPSPECPPGLPGVRCTPGSSRLARTCGNRLTFQSRTRLPDASASSRRDDATLEA